MPTISTFVWDDDQEKSVEFSLEVRYPARRWDVDRCTRCKKLVVEKDGAWVSTVEPKTSVCTNGGAHYPKPEKVNVGGYYVQHAGTGVNLGWVTKEKDGTWEARCATAAFLGDGTTGDLGYSLDNVPNDLINYRDYSVNSRGPGHDAVGLGSTREEAAEALLYWLVKHRAPQAGFPAHPDVVTWEARFPRIAR